MIGGPLLVGSLGPGPLSPDPLKSGPGQWCKQASLPAAGAPSTMAPTII